MQWHREMLRGFRDNAAYEVGRALILLIAPFVLAPIYTALSRLGAWDWNWRIHAGLILVAVIILCFTAWKLIRQRPPASKARLSELSRSLDEQIEDGRVRIENIKRGVQSGPMQGFLIDALPPIPDLKNITQVAWEKGNVIFTADAAVSVRNLLPAQGIDLVHFRLLSITPPMGAVKVWRGHTQDAILERIDFSADIPATLVAGKASTVKLFKASRPPLASKSLKDVSIEFYGKWPDEHYAVFTPQERHELVVEVTGNGVSREEATFELRFSCKKNESVFSIKTIRSAVGKG